MRALQALLLHHHRRAQEQSVQRPVRKDVGALAQLRRLEPLPAPVQLFSAQLFYPCRWTLRGKGAISGPNGAPCQ